MFFSKFKIVALTGICILFGSGLLRAQNNGEQTFEIIESVNDSIDLRSNFYDETDSLSEYFPASGLYESWDNDGIYYPKVDFSAKKDTTVICLCDNKTNFYVQPIKGKINSEFGFRHRRFHYGTDIDLKIGDTIRCAFDGMVRVARYHKGYGNVVVVRHFNGLETVYGHMTASVVRENQLVKAGTMLGFGGSTGHSTGPHLHFEIRYLGAPINPRKVVDFDKFQLYCDTLFITNKTFEKAKINTYASKSSVSSQKKYTSSYQGGSNYHYVKKGETLGHIAGMHHTSLANIYRLNGLSPKSVLQIGQKIRVK
jgi:murein DD-endopeptidase MepM/ murein hydrolase activator NlpD